MNAPYEIFTVTADPETGEWHGTPEPTGQTTDVAAWAEKTDTDAEHYDTYQHFDGAEDMHGTTRALIVRWQEYGGLTDHARDVLSNEKFADVVAACLRGRDHPFADSHARDAAAQLKREGAADAFLREVDGE